MNPALRPCDAAAQTLVHGGWWLGAEARAGLDLTRGPPLFGGRDRIGSVLAVSTGGAVNDRWRLGVELIGAGDTGNLEVITVYRSQPTGPVYVKGGLGTAIGHRWQAGVGATTEVGYYLPVNSDWGALGVNAGLLLQWFGRPVDGRTTTLVVLFGIHGFLW